MSNSDERIVWIDVETNGLDTDTDYLLQVACIVTDGNLQELDNGFEQKIYYAPEKVEEIRAETSDYVNEMHEKTKLWDKLDTEGRPLELVEQDLLAYIVKHVAEPETARLGGNSITLDRNFLKSYLPGVYNYIYYRSYDMSSVSGFIHLFAPDVPKYEKKFSHDALDDIRESIAEAKHYSTYVKTISV